jgi:hypothetical protein
VVHVEPHEHGGNGILTDIFLLNDKVLRVPPELIEFQEILWGPGNMVFQNVEHLPEAVVKRLADGAVLIVIDAPGSLAEVAGF